MARSAVEHVEAFHLVFLRALEGKLGRSHYVVKGGFNLRAWFGSLRYSQDVDLDALDVEPHVLTESVDTALAGTPFRMMLSAQGLTVVRSAKPKQTSTIQRWKFQIRPAGSEMPLHTKIEFSRRDSPDEYILEPVRPEVVRPYGIPAPTLYHYTAPAAARQKIVALAGRTEPQARDVWDLDHLLRTSGVELRPLSAPLRRALAVAVERVIEMPFAVYRAQVVPFIPPESVEIFGTTEAWDRMRELVVDRLLTWQG
jgi:hypothetical protein